MKPIDILWWIATIATIVFFIVFLALSIVSAK